MTTLHEETTAAEAEGIIAVDTDPAAISLIARYKAVRDARDAATRELETLKSDILSMIDAEHAQAFTIGGKVEARRSEVQTNRVDQDKLKAEHPAIYAECMKVTETIRLTVSK